MDTDGNGDALDIPPFLKRADKAPAPVVSEVTMSNVESTEAEAPKTRKPRKATAKPNGAAKAQAKVKAAPKAAKAAKAAPKAKAKAKAATPTDDYGYREGSLKSQAAAMYGSKKGATLEEVKAKLKSVQLNLLTDLEAKGFKVSKVKEDGPGKRQVTRYHLRSK
jgi:hypothetical protein